MWHKKYFPPIVNFYNKACCKIYFLFRAREWVKRGEKFRSTCLLFQPVISILSSAHSQRRRPEKYIYARYKVQKVPTLFQPDPNEDFPPLSFFFRVTPTSCFFLIICILCHQSHIPAAGEYGECQTFGYKFDRKMKGHLQFLFGDEDGRRFLRPLPPPPPLREASGVLRRQGEAEWDRKFHFVFKVTCCSCWSCCCCLDSSCIFFLFLTFSTDALLV